MRIHTSIRNILTLNFILVAALPMVAVGLLSLHFLQASMHAEITEKNNLLAQSLAAELKRFLGEPEALLHQIGQSTEQKIVPKNEIDNYLGVLIKEYEFFEMLLIIDDKGIVRHVAPYDSNVLGIDMSNRDFFRDTYGGTRPHWSKTFLSTRTGQSTLTLAIPYDNGVVVGYLSLEELAKITGKIHIGKAGYGAIADRDGTVIAHLNQKLVAQRLNVKYLKHIQEGSLGREGTYFYEFDRQQRIASTAIVPQTGWIVGIVQSTAEAFAPVYRVRNVIGMGIVIALVLGIVVAFISLRATLKPIAHIVKESKRIAGGDYTYQAKESFYTEIVNLGNSFQSMLEAIKSREHDLQESRRSVLTLMGNLPGMAYRAEYNPQRTMLFVSEGCEDLTGLPPAKLVDEQKPFIEIIHPEDREQVLTEIAQAVNAGKAFNITYRLQTASGKTKWIWEKGCGIAAPPQNIQIEGFATDITDKKKAEEELRHLRNFLSNIIDSMPSVLVGVDTNARVTQWNRQAERETGIRASSAIGCKLTDVFPRLLVEESHIRRAIDSGLPQRDPKRTRFENNEIRYEDITVYPLTANGIKGVVVRVDDVTEHVRMEEMIIQSEKMLSIGGLAAGMAHEINNPLAGIIQTITVLQNRLSRDLPANMQAAEDCGISMEAIKQYMEKREILPSLERIHQSGARAANIVRDMLSFARQGDSNLKECDLVELLDKTIELARNDYNLKKNYDFRQIEIVKEYQSDLPKVVCEPGKIQQVFLNLLKNGGEAMFENTETGEQPRFTLRLSKREDFLHIEVADNGPGIPEEIRKRIFEPFFTTKRAGVGTGLGLSVSYFIITENHGGNMSVWSAPGQGTTFTVELPINTDTPQKS